jgi:Zn-dependent protease with chaperone function/Zn-finger nucleic acid-binding protein
LTAQSGGGPQDLGDPSRGSAPPGIKGDRRTLFEIEREKRWRVWLLFGLLVATIAAAVWIACLIVAVAFYLSFPVVDTVSWVLRPRVILLIVVISLAVSVVYWFACQVGARARLLRVMHCAPLDPSDRYHHRLANIVEEMRIATGAPRIECRVVPTLGFNAFAFSDLHGAGVIGVTEGALSRLSRQQLQAVVAHEFAHILSGDHVTATVSCLLFGVYSAIGDELEGAMLATASARAAPVVLGALFLRGWVWVLQVASDIMTAALSRERERHADLAAARYTRDPLSLAEALRIIGRHPGCAGSIAEGLAPLCIRATGDPRGRLFGLRRDTHPPIGERVDALLALAHVSPAAFERQVEQAGERFDRREHWAAPPGAHVAAPADAPSASSAVMACPDCGDTLEPVDYEGMCVWVCRGCCGRLVSGESLKRILARREMGFTADQEHLADVLAASGDQLRRVANLARGKPSAGLISCPRCGKTMMRGHVSYQHAVEVDRCHICGLIWFQKDELEALQLLAERETG